ncbi:MAG TPA: hypothetical protein VH560_04920 [Polyangia bacterium]|jgi:hypothetical protein|nr:hypothetical protein [Polyangia bacterium]
MKMTARHALVVVTTFALSIAACSRGTTASAGGCASDDACGDGNACLAGTCLPRAAPPTAWACEVEPKTDSASADTELTHASGPSDAFDLTATASVTITGKLTFDASAIPLTTAHLVLTTPSAIPGRADLQYETDLIQSPTAAAPAAPAFAFSVPKTVIGNAGTLLVLPTAPDDATHPPATFAVTLTTSLALQVSSKTFAVQGRLLSVLGDAQNGLVARALQDGALASNVVLTGAKAADGAFTLVVPMDRVAAPGATAITVELQPAATDAADPSFWSKPITLASDTDLGDLHLPAFSQPDVFNFVVRGDTDDAPPVAGAIVRAKTLLAEDATGTTDFLRDGMTDGTGVAHLSLLPGSAGALRTYDVSVVPPVGSSFATQCLAAFPLSAGGNLPAITLSRRALLTGTVQSSQGAPVAGVVVLATLSAPDPTAAPSPCAQDAGPAAATTTTGVDGTFTLRLDPGTYRFDYDPTAGSPFPRLTEPSVVVGATGARTIQLPAGALVEGTLRDSGGQPLPLAGVRFYQIVCTSPATCIGPTRVAPNLLAQAHSDGNGHYRAVIPTSPIPPNTQPTADAGAD